MTIATSCKTFLDANVNIAALVSDRIYMDVIPAAQTTRPCLTFSIEAALDFPTFVAGENDTRQVDLEVRAWAPQKVDADALAEVVYTELRDYVGSFGADTADMIRFENRFDLPPDFDNDMRGVAQRFRLTYY